MFPYSAMQAQQPHLNGKGTQVADSAWQMYTSIEMADRSSTGEQLSIVIHTYFSKKSSLNEASETSLS